MLDTDALVRGLLHAHEVLVVVLDADGHVQAFGRGFEKAADVAADHAQGRTLDALAAEAETIEGRHLLHDARRAAEGHDRPDWSRTELQGGGILLLGTEPGEALRRSEAHAQAVLDTVVDGIIVIDDRGKIERFNGAAERIFGYTAAEVIGENVRLLMPDPYREEHDDYLEAYHETGRRRIIGIGREVRGRRKDGSTFPMYLAVGETRLPGENEDEEGYLRFTGLVRDLTEQRRLERELLESTESERRRIGQDLHDGLGQMLTGISLISKNLARRLAANGMPGASEVEEIASLVREADEYARTLSHSLVPVEVESNGLVAALERFAVQAQRLLGAEVHFEASSGTHLDDPAAATHLYRIAQEATHNAAKHGQARHIDIRLAQGPRHLRLRIEDDGVGFPATLPQDAGVGVRTMHYRARVAGGTLEITGGDLGTAVTCTLPHAQPEPV